MPTESMADHVIWGGVDEPAFLDYDSDDVSSPDFRRQKVFEKLKELNIDPGSIIFKEDESQLPEVPTKCNDKVQTSELLYIDDEDVDTCAAKQMPIPFFLRLQPLSDGIEGQVHKKCAADQVQAHKMSKLDLDSPTLQITGKDDVGSDRDVATTLMIRNLPYSVTREELIEAVDASGFADLYNFVYLPHRWNKQLGFTFINFINVDVAQRFHAIWHKSRRFKAKCTKGIKPLNVSVATVQGHTSEELQAYMNKIEIASKIGLGGRSRRPVPSEVKN